MKQRALQAKIQQIKQKTLPLLNLSFTLFLFGVLWILRVDIRNVT